VEKCIDRLRMREYSANIGDALGYKIRVFAVKRSKMEMERAKRFNHQANRKLKKQQQLIKTGKLAPDTPLNPPVDFMSTTNATTMAEIEKCADKEELRNLILRRQPKLEQKIAAGGALNYLSEAYQFIVLEE